MAYSGRDLCSSLCVLWYPPTVIANVKGPTHAVQVKWALLSKDLYW